MVSPLQAELSPEPNKAILRSQCDHASYLSQFRSFYHHFRPYLHWYVVIRKLSILNNVSIVRNTRFQREGKEGRKQLLGVFLSLAELSIDRFLKTHVCTIYGEKQDSFATVNQTCQVKSLWEEFQLRTHCGKFLLVCSYPLVDVAFRVAQKINHNVITRNTRHKVIQLQRQIFGMLS